MSGRSAPTRGQTATTRTLNLAHSTDRARAAFSSPSATAIAGRSPGAGSGATKTIVPPPRSIIPAVAAARANVHEASSEAAMPSVPPAPKIEAVSITTASKPPDRSANAATDAAAASSLNTAGSSRCSTIAPRQSSTMPAPAKSTRRPASRSLLNSVWRLFTTARLVAAGTTSTLGLWWNENQTRERRPQTSSQLPSSEAQTATKLLPLNSPRPRT